MTDDKKNIKEGIIQRLESRLTLVNNKLDQAQAELEDLKRNYLELQIHEADLRHRWTMLNASTVIVLLKKYRNIRDRILPPGTRRRSLYNSVLHFLYRLLTHSNISKGAGVNETVEYAENPDSDLASPGTPSPSSIPPLGFSKVMNIGDGADYDQHASSENPQAAVAESTHKLDLTGTNLLDESLSPAQRRRFYEIDATGYFDRQWYLAKNPDVFEAGMDALEHYVSFGAKEGRDPNPLFKSSIYLRNLAEKIPPERALMHFWNSGRTIAPGAYRSVDELISAQRAYWNMTDMELVEDRRSSPKQFAVYLQCGSGSLHELWLPETHETWDLIVNHYDETYASRIPCELEFIQTGVQPGTKFTAISRMIENWPRVLQTYDYLLLLDDDIVFPEGDVSELFRIAEFRSLHLAQASLSQDSFCAHPVIFNRGGEGIRLVNAVEIMMPVLSRRALFAAAHLFTQTISGWGLDMALGKLVSEDLGGKVAIIDAVVAEHSKEIDTETGSFYTMLHRAMIYPEIELAHLSKLYRTGMEVVELSRLQ